MSTCNRLDLQTLGSQPMMPKNLPDHCCSNNYNYYYNIWHLTVWGCCGHCRCRVICIVGARSRTLWPAGGWGFRGWGYLVTHTPLGMKESKMDWNCLPRIAWRRQLHQCSRWPTDSSPTSSLFLFLFRFSRLLMTEWINELTFNPT